MNPLRYRCILLSACLALFSTARCFIVQDSWIAPPLPDLSIHMTEGTNYTFSWAATLAGWFSQYAYYTNPQNCDLWLVQDGNTYSQRIASSVDVTTTFNLTWPVAVSNTVLQQNTGFSVQFKRTTYAFGWNSSDQISSPHFIIRAQGSTATTASSAASQSTITSVPSTTSNTATSTASTGTATSSQGSTATALAKSSNGSGVGAGAIAGIVIGAIAVIALIVLGVWFVKRSPRHQSVARPSSAVKHPYEDSPPYSQSMQQTQSQMGRHEMEVGPQNKYPRTYEMGS